MPVHLELGNLKLRSLDLDFHELSWSVITTTEDVLDYKFEVLRSESVEGPYDSLTPPFEDRYSFVDNVLQVVNRWRQYNYKIRVTHKQTGESREFGPVSHEPEPDIVALELRRHIRLLMKEFAGRRCIILPIRTFGQRCGCFDEVLNKRVRSGCITCFDTGFVRGYMHPIESWIQIDPSSKSRQLQTPGTTQQDNTTARFGFYPPVKPGDLLIEPENIRWRITQQTQTEKERAPVHQEVQLHRIPEKDIEYKIPVRFGEELKNLWLSPSRNYSNPTNFENFLDQDLPDIFELYNIEQS